MSNATTTPEATTNDTALISPYKAAQLINEMIQERTPGAKALPPQMFYTYVKKGYIPSDDNKKVNVEDLKEWFQNYSDKKDRLAKEKAEKVAAELAGE